MKLTATKIPKWIKHNITEKGWNIDTDKYFVMTENPEEHIGFMKEEKDENGESYFEIVIFDPEVEKEIKLCKYFKKRENWSAKTESRLLEYFFLLHSHWVSGQPEELKPVFVLLDKSDESDNTPFNR